MEDVTGTRYVMAGNKVEDVTGTRHIMAGKFRRNLKNIKAVRYHLVH